MSNRSTALSSPWNAVVETGAAINTAVRLAAGTKARLHAVFVEDEQLLRLAGLPVAGRSLPVPAFHD